MRFRREYIVTEDKTSSNTKDTRSLVAATYPLALTTTKIRAKYIDWLAQSNNCEVIKERF